MDISIRWDRPRLLVDGAHEHRIYTLRPRAWDTISAWPGVYVFGRMYGDEVKPLYVGQAQNLYRRIDKQFNNMRLMKQLEWAAKGKRVLMVGEITTKSGQDLKRVLDVAERALIEHALAEGHDLFNVHGARFKVHAITNEGSRKARSFAPRTMQRRRRLR